MKILFLTILCMTGFFIFGNDELCVQKRIFGVPCPGCGMTRAFLAFFRGDMQAAFFFHPLFWLVPFIFIVVIMQKRITIFKSKNGEQFFWLGCTILFVGTYVLRMIYLFPHTVPMDFSPNAFLPSLLRMMFS